MTQLTLREARKYVLKWNQDQLAKELGISRRTLVRYEQGHIPPGMFKLVQRVMHSELKRLSQSVDTKQPA